MDDWRTSARSADAQRLFDEAAAARRFQRRLRDVAPPRAYARPTLQYSESGYPIEPRASFAERVRRLITG